MYNREGALARIAENNTRRAGWRASFERGLRQTATSSELATVNMMQRASALVSVLVSRSAVYLKTRSDACQPSMSRRARYCHEILLSMIVPEYAHFCSALLEQVPALLGSTASILRRPTCAVP